MVSLSTLDHRQKSFANPAFGYSLEFDHACHRYRLRSLAGRSRLILRAGRMLQVGLYEGKWSFVVFAQDMSYGESKFSVVADE